MLKTVAVTWQLLDGKELWSRALATIISMLDLLPSKGQALLSSSTCSISPRQMAEMTDMSIAALEKRSYCCVFLEFRDAESAESVFII